MLYDLVSGSFAALRMTIIVTLSAAKDPETRPATNDTHQLFANLVMYESSCNNLKIWRHLCRQWRTYSPCSTDHCTYIQQSRRGLPRRGRIGHVQSNRSTAAYCWLCLCR